MGDYTPPATPATCESVVDESTVHVDGSAEASAADAAELDVDVCLDVDLTDDDLVDVDSSTGVTVDVDTTAASSATEEAERRLDRLDSRRA